MKKFARTAKKILQGTNPSDIPLTRNQLSATWLNVVLAQQINFKPDEEVMSKAKIVGQ